MINTAIITLDLNPLDPELVPLVRRHVVGSILDTHLLDTIQSEYEIDLIFHLAALLSTRSEFAPMAAHRVNVEGTMAMLEFAQQQGESHGRPVRVPVPVVDRRLRPADPSTRRRQAGKVKEDDSQPPDDDVRLQQALLRDARPLLRPALQATRGRAGRRARSISAASASPA